MLGHFHPEGLLLLPRAAITEHHWEVRADLLLSPGLREGHAGRRPGACKGLVLKSKRSGDRVETAGLQRWLALEVCGREPEMASCVGWTATHRDSKRPGLGAGRSLC